MRTSIPLIASALASILLAGCTQMAIDGKIVDVSGQPLADVRITAIEGNCMTTSGVDGKFALTCPPGDYSLVIDKDGYIELKVEISAPGHERYDLGKKVMVKIPDEHGLFLFQADAYVPLKRAYLTRTIEEADGGTTRRYCLEAQDSEPNELAAGQQELFDNQTPGWRAFTLDEQGCAYRDRKDEHAHWEVLYKEKPESVERQLEPGKKVAVLALPAGNYFIADWDQGFFTTDEQDKKRYTGFWLKVGGG